MCSTVKSRYRNERLTTDRLQRTTASRALRFDVRLRERTGNVATSGTHRFGQGFVDELFGIWPGAHPEIALERLNTNRAVAFLVREGLPGSPGPQETTR